LVNGGASQLRKRKKGTILEMTTTPEVDGGGVTMILDEFAALDADVGQIVVVSSRGDEGRA
jgi:hypothetical protein